MTTETVQEHVLQLIEAKRQCEEDIQCAELSGDAESASQKREALALIVRAIGRIQSVSRKERA